MARSNKPIVWSLFAAGGTLAAFAAPVLAAVFLAAALGHAPAGFGYERAHALAAHWFGKLVLGTVVVLFLWHAAHRLRITLHDVGLRADTAAAVVLYLGAAIGSVLAVLALVRI
jgi:fumarate reductase subunit D